MTRLLLAVPVLILVVLFALSNKQSVRVVLWPTDYAVDAPLSLLVLAAAGLAFLVGGIVAWAGGGAARRRARRAEGAVRTLEAQVEALRAQLAQDRGAPALPARLARLSVTKLIAALDTADPARAAALAVRVGPHCALLKLGLEYVLANGPAGSRRVTAQPVFLDLKLHDIPNTVGRAVAGLLRADGPAPAMLTLHAAGGTAMLEAARAAVDASGAATKLIAVTVLTSLDAEALHATGVAGGPRQQVLRLARLALAAGADGLVCSPREAAMLRDALGGMPILVVPGVRPAGCAQHDQARAATPREAAEAGADYIVVGRPITDAADPAAAAAAIAAELA